MFLNSKFNADFCRSKRQIIQSIVITRVLARIQGQFGRTKQQIIFFQNTIYLENLSLKTTYPLTQPFPSNTSELTRTICSSLDAIMVFCFGLYEPVLRDQSLAFSSRVKPRVSARNFQNSCHATGSYRKLQKTTTKKLRTFKNSTQASMKVTRINTSGLSSCLSMTPCAYPRKPKKADGTNHGCQSHLSSIPQRVYFLFSFTIAQSNDCK